jgi:Cft2 family RNA processing exonuclease
VFTGFQIPRTAGRYLLDTGRYVADEVDLAVKMAIHSLDFSAHSGRTQLLEFVNKIRPKNVICMHGDYCERFATELKGRFGIETVAPKTGDVLKF